MIIRKIPLTNERSAPDCLNDCPRLVDMDDDGEDDGGDNDGDLGMPDLVAATARLPYSSLSMLDTLEAPTQ